MKREKVGGDDAEVTQLRLCNLWRREKMQLESGIERRLNERVIFAFRGPRDGGGK